MRQAILLLALAALVAVPVRAADPPKVDLSKGVTFVGRAEASATVEVRSRVSGYLTKVNVRGGQMVRKGDVLAEVDDRAYQAELKTAKTKLEAAQAAEKRAAADLERATDGFRKGIVPRSDVATNEAAFGEAKARAEAAKAEVENATVNLAYAKIVAPIDGRVRAPYVDADNLVRANDTIIATIFATDTVFVDFDVDERTALAVQRAISDKTGKPAVEVALADEEGYPHKATFDHIDCQVDPKTGTVRFRASLANPKGLLSPGSFLRVRLTLPK
jgi:RND family efflux transporter MFP subunit